MLLQAHDTDLDALLDAYARDFDWYAFCLVCSHVAAPGQDSLQALYRAQALRRGSRMQELFPLVCAHWDVVDLAHRMAAVRGEAQRRPLEVLLRRAKAKHRDAMRELRQAWGAAQGAA